MFMHRARVITRDFEISIENVATMKHRNLYFIL